MSVKKQASSAMAKKSRVIPDSLYSTMTSGHGTTSGLEVDEEEQTEHLQHQEEIVQDFDDDERMQELLQRLADDAELHKLLAEEKMRGEIHKSNYEKLKAEYLKLAHTSKQMMSEAAHLEAQKVTMENEAKLEQKKLEDQLEQLKSQIAALQSQVPSEAERILLDRDMKNKHEAVWRGRLNDLMEDLEAAKLSIHQKMQENLSLKMTIEQNTNESQRLLAEAKVSLEAQIERLRGEKETLVNNQRPQMRALEENVSTLSKENVKLRHQIKVLQEQQTEVHEQLSSKIADTARLEQNLFHMERAASVTSKQLETEVSNLKGHVARIEQQLMDCKVKNNDLKSDLKLAENEVASSRQLIEVMKTEAEVKLSRQRMEAAKEVSRLECHIDQLKHMLKESQEKAAKLNSQVEVHKMDEEKVKLEFEHQMQNERRELNSIVAQLEARQSELIEKLKACHKQLAGERLLRQQKEREAEANVALLDRKGQEVDLLKALLAKLQKYGRDFTYNEDIKYHQEGQKSSNKALIEDHQALKAKYADLVENHRKFAKLLQNMPNY